VKTQRWVLAGLAAIATLSFGTACTQPGTPSSTPTTPASATQTLADAAAKTKGQSYKYQLTYGTALNSDGATSASGTAANITIGDASSGLMIKAQVVVTAKDIFLKLDTGAIGSPIPGLALDKWLHLDPAKATMLARVGVKPGTDSLSADSMLKGVLTATQSSPTEIKGTLDLAKSAPPGVSADQIAAMPANTRNVPFTVTLDAQGRVSKVVISMPAVGTFPASDVTTTYTDFGTSVNATPPAAADTVEAPDMVYLFLK
jgi:hypothetical protein